MHGRPRREGDGTNLAEHTDGSPLRTDPILLAERQGVVFVATSGDAGGHATPFCVIRSRISVIFWSAGDPGSCRAIICSSRALTSGHSSSITL